MAASAVLIALPLSWAVLMLRGDDPEPAGVSAQLLGIEGVSASIAAAEEAARLALPREPLFPTPPRDAQAAVVFPGYVLPDDGSEEPAHAGS